MTTADDLPLRAWDELGRARRARYDALRRPTHLYVAVGGPERLQEFTVYGEARPARRRPTMSVGSIRSTTGRRGDDPGVRLQGEWPRGRTPVRARPPDDGGLVRALDGLPDLAAVENAADALLGVPYASAAEYDAVGRVVARTTADRTTKRAAYNGAPGRRLGSLERLEPGDVVRRRGRVRRARPPGVDPVPTGSRPVHVRRAVAPPRALRSSDPGNGHALQDLRYTYDAKGNVVELQDHAQETVYFRNAVVPAHP